MLKGSNWKGCISTKMNNATEDEKSPTCTSVKTWADENEIVAQSLLINLMTMTAKPNIL